MGKRLFVVLALVMPLSALAARKGAPVSEIGGNTAFVPKEVWKDTDGNMINAHGAGLLRHGGVWYMYGEYKKGKTTMYTWDSGHMERTDVSGVSCYSSRDLMNWKFEGVALKPEPEDTASDLHPRMVCERPKVIYNRKTGKFVMWFHCDTPDYLKASAGVAVSDSPAGPFTYIGSSRPNGEMSRDQTLFVDDDGTAYQVASSENNATIHVNRLTCDYQRPDGTSKRTLVRNYREAPAVFKCGGKYYMLSSGCSGWAPNKARIAVADSMLGDWKLLGNPCTGPDAGKTFYGQSTHVIPVKPDKGVFIACFDMWNSKDLADSRYIWLPMFVDKETGTVEIPWRESWTMKDLSK